MKSMPPTRCQPGPERLTRFSALPVALARRSSRMVHVRSPSASRAVPRRALFLVPRASPDDGSSMPESPETSADEEMIDGEFAGSSPGSSYDEQRKSWAASVRSTTGRRKHRVWEPQVLDPPPLLEDVKVVMVRTKRPVTIGTVARACSSFELENICMVAPDCDPLQRSGRNASCGAQYLLHRLEYCDTVQDAVADCTTSVAFTRWLPGQKQKSVRSMTDLISALKEKGMGGKIALVFGREDTGLFDEEIEACDMVCSIPIGRLQESLSVSHAVTIPLSQIFESRLEALGNDAKPWL